jgi:hypothetical protein
MALRLPEQLKKERPEIIVIAQSAHTSEKEIKQLIKLCASDLFLIQKQRSTNCKVLLWPEANPI